MTNMCAGELKDVSKFRGGLRMDGFERAGVPSHKWREAGDSGSVRGSKKFKKSIEKVGSEVRAKL